MSPHEFNIVLTLFGFTLLALGLASGIIKNRWNVSEPLLALAAGAVASPFLPGFLEGDVSMTVIEQTARVTLTIALIDVATDLPPNYLRERWRVLLAVLGIVMPLMWLLSWSIAWAVLGLPLLTAMLLAAVITPTDPVLAASIVGGRLAERHVPERLRHAIIAESGANDVLALVLVSLSLLCLGQSESHGAAAWLLDVLVLEILGGIAIGAVAGFLIARALRFVSGKPYANRASLITVALALAVALLGMARLIGSDGILAAFVAGLMLNDSLTGDLVRQKNLFHETIRRFFELPVFILLGLLLPWAAWLDLGARAAAFALLLLGLRRLPAVWLSAGLLQPVRDRRDKLFLGWFGPVGIAALYYAALAVAHTGDQRIWHYTSLAVAASVLVHGVSGTGFTKWYGRNRHRS